MDSIWGDPWADNAKPEPPSPKKGSVQRDEVTDYEIVKPAANAFPNGFEDEAGWGDFEESTGLASREAEGSRNEELGWSDRQGHEEDISRELEAEPRFEHSNGFGILSPGWHTVQTLPSTSRPPVEARHGDTYRIPPSSIWESPRTSISSPPSAPESPVRNDIDRTIQSTKPNGKLVFEDSPRPSTSSTTHTAVSTDVDGFSQTPVSPNDHNNQRWTRELSHSDASGDNDPSGGLDSLRTSFDDAYIPSKRTEGPKLYMEKLEERTASGAGALQSMLHVDEERAYVSLNEKKAHDEDEAHVSPEIIQGPQFNTNLKLVRDIFKIESASKSYDEANDELIDSTSTRKAWYRLTRSQTMREFNMGATDDSYVRVSWPKSHVRTETLKFVTRWASEDRINGRVVLGGKTRATAFGWDMPSDGSIMPPRQTSMTKPTPLRKESGKRYIPHERQPSISHQSNLTSPSPVAQFSWSTSPSGNGRPGSGIITSIGDVLEPQSVFAAPDNQLHVAKQRQNDGMSGPTTRRFSPAMSSGVENSRAPSTHSTELGDKRSPRQPALSKIDTTKSALGSNKCEEDDDEWGEMVKSPSAPHSPNVLPTPLPISASDVKPTENREDHVPIISSRRRPTPIVAPPGAQILPETILSPARKAAFDAARATRFLTSQQRRNESPSTESNESRSPTPRSRGLSPSPSPSMMDSLDIVMPTSPSASLKSIIRTVRPVPTSFLEADLSFSEASAHQKPSHPARDAPTLVEITSDEEEHAQQIVRKIPNLSFMLR